MESVRRMSMKEGGYLNQCKGRDEKGKGEVEEMDRKSWCTPSLTGNQYQSRGEATTPTLLSLSLAVPITLHIPFSSCLFLYSMPFPVKLSSSELSRFFKYVLLHPCPLLFPFGALPVTSIFPSSTAALHLLLQNRVGGSFRQLSVRCSSKITSLFCSLTTF